MKEVINLKNDLGGKVMIKVNFYKLNSIVDNKLALAIKWHKI